jgi:hypothetical protein
MTQQTPYTAEELDMTDDPRLRLADEDEEEDQDVEEEDEEDDLDDDDGPDFGFEHVDNTEVDEDGLYPDGSSEDEPGPGMG